MRLFENPHNSSVQIFKMLNLFGYKFDIIADITFANYQTSKQYLHSHSYYEVFFVHHGDTKIMLDAKQSISIKDDFCYIIPPHTYHMLVCNDINPISLDVLRFTFNASENDNLVFLNSGLKCLPINKSINLAFKMIKEELSDVCWGSEQIIESNLGILIINLLREINFPVVAVSIDPNSSDPSRFDAEDALVIEDFFDYFPLNITASQLSQKLNISNRQLSRIMQKQYQCSFTEKLTQMRIYEAKKLLASTDIPLEKIPEMIGYQSSQTFYRIFKKHMGISPFEYRKIAKKSY